MIWLLPSEIISMVGLAIAVAGLFWLLINDLKVQRMIRQKEEFVRRLSKK